VAATRRDVAAAALLAILGFGLYAFRAAAPPMAASERPLRAAVDLLADRGGHDDAGRFLPLFVRVTSELWLPPVPAYTTWTIQTVTRAEQPARAAAALAGALGVGLTYLFASALFRARALGAIAALLLLSNPAYAIAARSGSADGAWIIPPLALSWIAVTRFAETGSRPALAVAAAALAVCVYAQPSGALLALIAGVAMAIALGRARLLTTRDAWLGIGVAAAAAVPIALWFLVHPTSYMDTFGRWVLHPAYIRHPWSLVIRMTNWFSLADWASIYWNMLDPTHLFYGVNAPGSAGTFLMACAVLLAAAAYDLAAPRQPRTAAESALLWAVAVGLVASPLVPASFNEPGAIHKALTMPLCGTILCALGIRALWTMPRRWTRIAVVLLLAATVAQFAAFYRSLVSLPS
jgi:4-amino-4-deoxy-L-arabinose transferase-like glycosyltransferase